MASLPLIPQAWSAPTSPFLNFWVLLENPIHGIHAHFFGIKTYKIPKPPHQLICLKISFILANSGSLWDNRVKFILALAGLRLLALIMLVNSEYPAASKPA